MKYSLPVLHRDFPDYDWEKYYEACIPLYRLTVSAKVVVQSSLSIIAQYILRAIALEIDTLPDIAHSLGLDIRDLAVAGADLSRAGLIMQQAVGTEGQYRLTLTKQGTSYLKDESKLPVPRKRTFRMHFNRLSRQLQPFEQDAVSLDEMRKDDTFVIPTNASMPRLEDIRLADVRDIVETDSRQRGEFEVVLLLELVDSYPQYIRGVDIFALRHRGTGEKRMVAYKGGQRLQAESLAIENLHIQGVEVIPDDADTFMPDPVDLGRVLDTPLAAAAEQIIDKEQAISQISRNITAKQAIHSATQSTEERRALEREVEQLKEKLAELETERNALIAKAKQFTDREVDFLSTEQHRPTMLQALSQAKQEVIIISPWMNKRAVDVELCELIRDAAKRGVKIRIGYGIGQNNQGADAERKRQQARDRVAMIRSYTRDAPNGQVNLINVRETHEKILICDDSFGVLGSFNWLSYRGEKDAGYRREAGILLRDPVSVRKLRQTAEDAFAVPAAP